MKNCAFIIGICPRSGTNFLYNLLLRHPDCAPSIRGGQDSLLYKINLLNDYVNKTEFYWKDHWGQSKSELRHSISNGIIDYLIPNNQGTKAKIHITKTPNTFNLDNFFEFFPNCKLIISLRSGQDAIESGMRSFPWNFDDACKMYKESAIRIKETLKKYGDNPNLKVVHYENLASGNIILFSEILEFLGLEASKYDLENLSKMPVYGSSSLKNEGNSQEMHWKPVKKEESFNPVGRSRDWSKWKHWRFNYWVGTNVKSLGYDLLHNDKNLFFLIYNIWKDLSYFVYRVVRKIRGTLSI